MNGNTYALVTGASQGIGKAIARELAARGRHLILVSRREAELQAVSREIESEFPGIRAVYRVADLSLPEAPSALVHWCGEQGLPIDVLVNNAGYGLSGPFAAHPLDAHENMMALNMTALVRLCYLLLPALQARECGYILNVASTAAYQATPFLGLYAASKSFVLLFSRALSRELRKTSVSVTCVSPGSTDTSFNDRAQLGKKGRELAKKVQMTPDSVAKTAVDAMYARKPEVVVGLINKLGVFLAWLMPKGIVEGSAAKIYE